MVDEPQAECVFRPDPKKKVFLLNPKAYAKLRFDTWLDQGGRCACKRFVPLLDPEGVFDVFTCAHLSHVKPRKRYGDGPENIKGIECFECHIANGHLKWRSDKKCDPWVCDFCAQIFDNEVDLLAHQFNSHCEQVD